MIELLTVISTTTPYPTYQEVNNAFEITNTVKLVTRQS